MGHENSKGELDLEAVTRLVAETKLSEDEIQKSYRGFLADYPDGKLTVDQLKDIYGNLFPDGEVSKFIEFVFRTFDENGDGSIDFREFVIALSATRRGSLRNKLKWIFSVYDLNSDGCISKMEMLEVLTAVYKIYPTLPNAKTTPNDAELTPEERVDKIFQLMDKNCDEQLSLSEFMEGVKKNPGIEVLVYFSLTDSHTYF